MLPSLKLLSPSNKRSGKGRQQYEEKRLKILASRTHLVEIDLIRAFPSLPMRGGEQPHLYRILVSAADQRPRAALYPFNLASPMPAFPLPLQSEDPAVVEELQSLLDQIYERAGYDLAIDYTQEPIPPLSEKDTAWAHQLLQDKQAR